MNLKSFKALGYGEVKVADQVDGADLLEGSDSEEEEGEGDAEEGWEGWETASEDGEASGEDDWTNVSDGEEEQAEEKGEEEEQKEGEEGKKPSVEKLRFLSEEDFRKIRRRKQRLEAERLAGITSKRHGKSGVKRYVRGKVRGDGIYGMQSNTITSSLFPLALPRMCR